ncbi:TetR family transcriptional regulator [Actinoplanes sp. NPDC049265]|uniref:TetR/AcrR family transcriptional regulator n=1 Tax=Actinoplanes sp. NPDC049265 TaxID=3363902 RepID=UPI00371B06E9
MTQQTRRRDAAGTRRALLDAARLRFATNGYAATTVRDIADSAGVNVSLISRYFTSKEGLFEACLTGAVDEFDRTVTPDLTIDEMPRSMVRNLADESGKTRLLLLLRSSGDPGADQVRRNVLRTFAERTVAVTGQEITDELLLRAELVLATALGLVLMRSVIGVEPLATVDQEALVAPLGDAIRGLLAPSPRAS